MFMRFQLLLNTTEVNYQNAALYEFILSAPGFFVNECYYVKNQGTPVIETVENPYKNLNGKVFEINHLRIDPKADPKNILNLFEKHLSNIGLKIPQSVTQHACWMWPKNFQLRFKLDIKEGLIFMSPSNPALKAIF
jgi:hypothetical protein